MPLDQKGDIGRRYFSFLYSCCYLIDSNEISQMKLAANGRRDDEKLNRVSVGPLVHIDIGYWKLI